MTTFYVFILDFACCALCRTAACKILAGGADSSTGAQLC